MSRSVRTTSTGVPNLDGQKQDIVDRRVEGIGRVSNWVFADGCRTSRPLRGWRCACCMARAGDARTG